MNFLNIYKFYEYMDALVEKMNQKKWKDGKGDRIRFDREIEESYIIRVYASPGESLCKIQGFYDFETESLRFWLKGANDYGWFMICDPTVLQQAIVKFVYNNLQKDGIDTLFRVNMELDKVLDVQKVYSLDVEEEFLPTGKNSLLLAEILDRLPIEKGRYDHLTCPIDLYGDTTFRVDHTTFPEPVVTISLFDREYGVPNEWRSYMIARFTSLEDVEQFYVELKKEEEEIAQFQGSLLTKLQQMDDRLSVVEKKVLYRGRNTDFRIQRMMGETNTKYDCYSFLDAFHCETLAEIEENVEKEFWFYKEWYQGMEKLERAMQERDPYAVRIGSYYSHLSSNYYSFFAGEMYNFKWEISDRYDPSGHSHYFTYKDDEINIIGETAADVLAEVIPYLEKKANKQRLIGAMDGDGLKYIPKLLSFFDIYTVKIHEYKDKVVTHLSTAVLNETLTRHIHELPESVEIKERMFLRLGNLYVWKEKDRLYVEDNADLFNALFM